MIKTLLQHYVFEKCINVAFNEVIKNFSGPKIVPYKIGSAVTKLAHKSGLNIKVSSRYAEVASTLGSGKYYRRVTLGDLNDEITGNSSN